MKTISMKSISLGLAAALLANAALAHGDHDPNQGKQKPPPFAILQLDQVRDATARFSDVDKAVAEGYADIGLFVPNMGWQLWTLHAWVFEYNRDGVFTPFNPRVP